MAVSSIVIDRGNKQYQGAFSEMWFVKATVDPASVAAGTTTDTIVEDDIAVPGVVLGDMVLGWSAGVDVVGLQVSVYVTAADVVTIQYANGTGGAIDLVSSIWKFVIGRPVFQ